MNVDRWPTVKDLFHAALEREAEERSAFLSIACHGDATLQAEVERLLVAHTKAASFIEPGPPAGGAGQRSIATDSRLTGRRIGRYDVGRLIGVGGMGEVYAAHDVELDREVALKIGSDSDHDAQARLRREAQHASQLNHPHICTIHEVGTFEGQAYIVMELVEGQRLADAVLPAGLHRERLLRYGLQIADGLAHAHQHGVRHRDLKSENVVITPDGRAKILDFGLAQRLAPQRVKALTESQTSFSEGTTDHVVAGTLSAMAPELLRGEPADERSDIWALGVLLYEMAAGSRPFAGRTGFELSGAILHKAPPPLPAHVPSSVQTIIRRSLAKDPGERYQHAGEVRAALEAVQPESPGDIRRPGFSRARLSSRHAAVVIATLILVLAGLGLWRLRPSPGQASLAIGAAGRPAVAVMQFENVADAGDLVWMSRGVPNMLLTGLAQTQGLDIVSAQRLHEVIRQRGLDGLESLDRSQMADVARRAGAGAIVVGSIVRSGSEIRIDAQLEDLSSGRVLAAESVRGTDLFGLVDQLATRIRDGVGFRNAAAMRHVAEVSTSSLDAYRLYSEGLTAYNNTRSVDARNLFEKAVTIDPSFAQAVLSSGSGHGPDGTDGRQQSARSEGFRTRRSAQRTAASSVECRARPECRRLRRSGPNAR